MKQTKAEQLARELDASVIAVYKDAAYELRRLSPMETELTATTGTLKNCMDSLFTVEAERDKLLAVNKMLVDALKLISETEQSKFAQAYCANMAATALKLTGDALTPTREQLELAAKAAGLKYYGYDVHKGLQLDKPYDIRHITWWNPITSKSDSRDLEVACEIDIGNGHSYVYTSYDDLYGTLVYYKDYNNDKGLATCAAVFLCAVEIGRNL
jgi:hypothetical protein